MKLFDKAEWATHVANDLDTNTVAGYFQGTSPWQVAVTNSHEDGRRDEEFPSFFPFGPLGSVVGGGMGYILLCLLSPGAVAGCPGNKNNKEINTGLIYTTVSPASQTRNTHQSVHQAELWKKISRKLFDLCGAMGSSHIMTQMVVDIFRPKYLHPP